MEKVYFISDSSESTKCQILQKALDDNRNLLESSWDYFVILLHALMLEVGFEPSSIEKKSKSYSFQYVTKNDQDHKCSLNVHRIGPITSIIGNYHGEPIQSFALTKTRISDFVSQTNNYSKLKDISQEFKDKIALPLMRSIQNDQNILSNIQILNFPDEILVKIAQEFSDAKNVKNFISTCRRFRSISEHPLLWKHLLKKKYPKKFAKASANGDWYQLYKEAVTEEYRNNRLMVRLDQFRYSEPPLSWIHFFDI